MSARTHLLLHVVALLAYSGLSVAQSTKTGDSTKTTFSIGSTHAGIGYLQFSAPDLDARFKAAGLPGVANSAATYGLGADFRFGRLLIGGGVQSMFSRDNVNASHRTRVSGSYGTLELGVAAVRTRDLSIYPIAGVGLVHLAINIKERGDFSFDDGLTRPSRELELSGDAVVWNTGVMAEHRFRWRNAEYAVSLRMGIVRDAGAQSWSSAESTVRGGPTGLRGSYTTLSFSTPLGLRGDAVLSLVGALVQAVAR